MSAPVGVTGKRGSEKREKRNSRQSRIRAVCRDFLGKVKANEGNLTLALRLLVHWCVCEEPGYHEGSGCGMNDQRAEVIDRSLDLGGRFGNYLHNGSQVPGLPKASLHFYFKSQRCFEPLISRELGQDRGEEPLALGRQW